MTPERLAEIGDLVARLKWEWVGEQTLSEAYLIDLLAAYEVQASELAKVREALECLLDNVETGSYESTGLAINKAKAVLAAIGEEVA